MFCKKCGAQMGGDERFCPNCGAPVDVAPVVPTPTPVAPTPAPVPVNPTPVAPAPVSAPAMSNPLDLRSHPLFLVAVICMSVVALFQLVSMFTSMGTLGEMSEAMEMMGMGEVSGAFSGVGVVTLLISLGTLAITAVILVGLWMTYASGLGEGNGATLVRGLKMVRGGLLAQMIYMIVMLSFLVIGLLMVLIVGGSMGSYYDAFDYDYYEYQAVSGAVTAGSLVALLIVAGIGVLMIVFYVKTRKAVSSALTTATTGEVTSVPSMFVPVMSFIMAGFVLLGALISAGAIGMLGIIDALASGAAYILFGIVAVQYRSRILAI